jgi:hypothetical protein
MSDCIQCGSGQLHSGGHTNVQPIDDNPSALAPLESMRSIRLLLLLVSILATGCGQRNVAGEGGDGVYVAIGTEGQMYPYFALFEGRVYSEVEEIGGARLWTSWKPTTNTVETMMNLVANVDSITDDFANNGLPIQRLSATFRDRPAVDMRWKPGTVFGESSIPGVIGASSTSPGSTGPSVSEELAIRIRRLADADRDLEWRLESTLPVIVLLRSNLDDAGLPNSAEVPDWPFVGATSPEVVTHLGTSWDCYRPPSSVEEAALRTLASPNTVTLMAHAGRSLDVVLVEVPPGQTPCKSW